MEVAMVKFYLNRELSESLGIRLSRWKRWSREFLPPDPLGGLQSGYARQYNLDQVFNVYLGGHLVSDLKFPMPEAKQILGDLKAWLMEKAFFFYKDDNEKAGEISGKEIENCRVYIFRNLLPDNLGVVFSYLERLSLSDEAVETGGINARQEVYLEKSIPVPVTEASKGLARNMAETQGAKKKMDSKILYITDLYDRFSHKLKI